MSGPPKKVNVAQATGVHDVNVTVVLLVLAVVAVVVAGVHGGL